MQATSLIPFYVASLVFSVAGFSPLNAMVLAVPVALSQACGRHGLTVALSVLNLAVLSVSRGSLAAGAVGTLISLGGVPAGRRTRRGGWFGEVAAVFALAQFAVIGLQMAVFWQENLANWQAFLDSQARLMAGTEGADAITGWREYLPHVVVGAVFAGCYMVALFQTQVLFGILRRQEADSQTPQPQGRFALMRPADGLVWLVIAVLSGMVIDYIRPSEAVRFVSWNLGVGLSAVYWFNGLGIVLFGLEVFRVHPLMGLALLVVLMVTSLQGMLLVFGFFDTWFDHRLMLARLAAARGRNDDGDGSGSPPEER